MADFFEREGKIIERGCLIDIVLLILGCIFPILFIGIIPYFIYTGFKEFKYYNEMLNMMNKADKALEEELKHMSPKQIEERRIQMIMILQSPFSTQAEKDAASYTIKYIERHYPKY